ncbi:MAG: hypothetical protein QNJ97_25065 [Myxococcota bacterium]|nr:hypothetical protein [Myxococcota bacterium]
MKKLSFIGMTCALIICNAWNAQGQMSEEALAQDWDDDEWDVYTQTPEEGLAEDLALVAKAKGWTIEEAAADRKAADEVGRIAEELAKKRPDLFVGSAVSEEPGGVPTLYVKGPAGPDVLDIVKSSEIEINVADRQPFSFMELEARQQKVNRSLEELGYKDYMTFFKLAEAGQIRAKVAVEANLPETAFEIVQSLPVEQRDYVHLSVSHVPVGVLEHAMGGMRAKDDGVFECTTGWTVGGNGVTTAAHCSGINQIDTPGGTTHTFPYQSQHKGQWGDVEWHTSSTIEEWKFYANSSSQRWTQQLEARANISENESICIYGRSSNDRDCSLDVESLSVSCLNAQRLVRMDGDATIGGDSGGGWSWNTRAYGSHVGDCSSRNVFSVADLFDEAIGRTVRLTTCPGVCTPLQTTGCCIVPGCGGCCEPGFQTCQQSNCQWGPCY